MSPVWLNSTAFGCEVEREARDGVRVGRVDWVRIFVGNHNHVEGAHVGGKLFRSHSLRISLKVYRASKEVLLRVRDDLNLT